MLHITHRPAEISAERQEQIPALTGLRFFAAAGVAWGHYVSVISNGPYALTVTWHVASLAMTLFFTLSGFVIHYNYAGVVRRPGGIVRFAVARIARLYPLYLLVMAIELASYSQNPNTYLVSTIISYLSMTQGWFPVYAIFHPSFGGAPTPMSYAFFGLSWSISVEVFLYLVYVPVAIFMLSRLTPRATAIAIVVHVVLWSAVFFASFRYQIGDRWLLYLSPYGRMPEFFLGALAAQFVVQHRDQPPSRWLPWVGRAGLLCVAAMIWQAAHGFGIYERMEYSWWFAPPVIVSVVYLALVRSVWTAMFGSALLVALGDASYSIYLLHPYLMAPFPRAFVGWSTAAYCATIFFAMASIIGIGVYEGFESPARTWIRRRATAIDPRFIQAALATALVAGVSSALYIAADAGGLFQNGAP